MRHVLLTAGLLLGRRSSAARSRSPTAAPAGLSLADAIAIGARQKPGLSAGPE